MSLTIGQKIGRWTILSFGERTKTHNTLWNCICKCGSERRISSSSLLKGTSKSCGCLRIDVNSSRKTHGQGGCSSQGKYPSKTYATWCRIKTRCSNKNNPDYDLYGSRGISVCMRWQKFENFLADMGEKPEGKSIDRINNDGNYEPGNCRWATNEEQANNKRSSHYLKFNNKKMTISQWSKNLSMSKYAIADRIHRGWNIKDALTRKVRIGNWFRGAERFKKVMEGK